MMKDLREDEVVALCCVVGFGSQLRREGEENRWKYSIITRNFPV